MRRTGRTFRAALQACYAASSGKHVIVIVDSFQKTNMLNRIREISDQVNANIIHKNYTITYPNSASISVIDVSDVLSNKLRAIDRNTYIVTDVEYALMGLNTRRKYHTAISEFHQRIIDSYDAEIY